MTRAEIDAIFEVDEDGRFVRLVVPPLFGFPGASMVGRKRMDLSREEVILVKKYAWELYANAEKTDA